MLFRSERMKLVTKEILDSLTEQAKENVRLRMNYNLHDSLEAPVHRLLNALEPETYMPPHRHIDKEETYLIMRGALMAYFFDDNGNVTEKVRLSAEDGNYALDIPVGKWHSLISLESGTVIFEVKNGPYRPLLSEEIAVWAPDALANKEDIKLYTNKLLAE